MLVCVAFTSVLTAQAPQFLAPTPCGQILTVQAGNTVTFTVTAAANSGQANETVILGTGALPAAASHTPALPTLATGNAAVVSSTFTWTTTLSDVGTVGIVYFANNQLQQQTSCFVIIDVVASTLPVFVPPTPCGQTLMASVGVPFSFSVVATAPGVVLALVSGPLPAGSTHNPPLPMQVSGTSYPVATSAFSWTPTNNDVGTHTLLYVALNQFGQSTFCQVQVVVAECFIFLGTQSTNWPLGGPDFLLVEPLFHFPVTMTQIPSFLIPNNPALVGLHIYAQIGMYNPPIFPSDPLQLSHGLDITIGVGTATYGSGGSGITLWTTQPPMPGNNLQFGFSIPGI